MSARSSDAPDRTRVLVVDKVSVLRANRLRWRRLASQYDIDLTLLAPTHWVENCVDERFQIPPDTEYRAILGKVSWPGRELLSVYMSGAIRALRASHPHVIVLMEESFSLFALQFTILRHFFAPQAQLVFYSFNIDSYQKFNYRLDRLYRWVSRYVMQRAAAGLCVNEQAVDVLRRSSFRGSIVPLFVGINDELFSPRDKAASRRACGVESNAILFLYAGRLLEQKGIEDLISAFDRLDSRDSPGPLRLLIVGQGEWEDRIRARAAQSPRRESIEVRAAVPIEQMPLLMASADAFVLPSRAEWNEQFGRVNAEAMLLGTTIIGSTSGAIPDVIGDGGFLYEAGNIDGLVESMSRVVTERDECDVRRVRARERALQRYSVQGFVDGVAALIASLRGRAIQRKEK